MRKQLTEAMLDKLRPPEAGRLEIFDAIVPAMAVRLTAAGAKTFIVRCRVKGHSDPIRLTIGDACAMKLSDARQEASDVLKACRAGIDPREARKAKREGAKNTFAAVCENFIQRHASKNRSVAETRRIFERYVLPSWGARPVAEIARRDVAELLDIIEDGKLKVNGEMLGGPVMADRVLAAVRKLFNWHAARDDTFISPVVRGMGRTKPKERARTRTLTDDEIRSLWPVLGQFGTFGALTKVLFLTAQRRDEVAQMSRSEIGPDGTWVIPAERYKTGKPNAVPLSKAALAVIEAQPVIDGCDFIFTTNGRSPFSGYSKAKGKLDAALPQPLPHWTLHDIRRTAKTLMARAGVRPDISERVLGHVIAGVEGVYDQHGYMVEKRAALENLAAVIARIVEPPPAEAKVVSLRGRAAQ